MLPGATRLEPNICRTARAPPTTPTAPPPRLCIIARGGLERLAYKRILRCFVRVRACVAVQVYEREREHRDAQVVHRYCHTVFGSHTNVRASSGIKTENTPVRQKWGK